MTPDAALLLHGAAGSLDELLIWGGGLAVLLAVYFFAVVREPKQPKSSDERLNDKDETN